jgi:hypothetical protein
MARHRLQHPAYLGHRSGHVVDVMQRHVGHGQVEGPVAERQPSRVRHQGRLPGLMGRREADHRRGGVDPHHPVAA